MKKLRLTKKQHEKDSEVFGAVMAGAKSRKKRLKIGLEATETSFGMCAIGAGNRGRKITRPSEVLRMHQSSLTYTHQLVPTLRFAVANDVTENYACGVNDGFEDGQASPQIYRDVDMGSADYLRGYHVGRAIRLESGYN